MAILALLPFALLAIFLLAKPVAFTLMPFVLVGGVWWAIRQYRPSSRQRVSAATASQDEHAHDAPSDGSS